VKQTRIAAGKMLEGGGLMTPSPKKGAVFSRGVPKLLKFAAATN